LIRRSSPPSAGTAGRCPRPPGLSGTTAGCWWTWTRAVSGWSTCATIPLRPRPARWKRLVHPGQHDRPRRGAAGGHRP